MVAERIGLFFRAPLLTVPPPLGSAEGDAETSEERPRRYATNDIHAISISSAA